jgi:hypothetical protein
MPRTQAIRVAKLSDWRMTTGRTLSTGAFRFVSNLSKLCKLAIPSRLGSHAAVQRRFSNCQEVTQI